MLDSIRNIFSIPDLRKRVVFTLLLLAVYRLGGQIPNPGISSDALAEFWQQQKGTILGFIDMFSGQYMSRMTIFALGIMPYISSSIILQLLTVVWPYLERLSKEGELGKKKITQYTRYGTIGICIIQAWGIALFLQGLRSPGGAP
ncbi:MAG: preprotein translocase subunit SecY, partial [Candidatus Aminicenantes bacterium]|nr:preprotein translocase subunit SecY [Candidatus Aminicenantes bacterium]